MVEKRQSDGNNGWVLSRFKRIVNDDQKWRKPVFKVMSFVTIREVASLNTRRKFHEKLLTRNKVIAANIFSIRC